MLLLFALYAQIIISLCEKNVSENLCYKEKQKTILKNYSRLFNYSQPNAIPHSILFCCNLQARELGICTSPSYWKELALQPPEQ